MTVRVIHVNDMPKHPDAVYIGRRNNHMGLDASPFANPFPSRFAAPGAVGRRIVVESYATWLTKGEGRHLLARLPELRGKPLACWCRHDGVPAREKNRCHGDVLVALLSEFTDDELRAMATGEGGRD